MPTAAPYDESAELHKFEKNELLNKAAIGTMMGAMRPLFHPSVDDITVGGILHALADPVRVAIYAGIIGSECSRNCSNFLVAANLAIPKSTLSQHFKVLREAGLVRGERHGVEVLNSSRCAEIDKRFPGLIAAIVKAHNIQMEGNAGKRKPRKRNAKTA